MRGKKFIARSIAWLAKQAASAYVAGPDVQDAVSVCNRLSLRGWSATICPWDLVGTPAVEVANSYHEALGAIANTELNLTLSVKVPSIAYDPVIFKELVAHAAEHDIKIHVDGMANDSVDRAFGLIEDVLPDYRNLGYTLAARWKRSFVDFERVKEWNLPVRLVKGQWPNPREEELSPREGFLRLVDLYCQRSVLVGIASHDDLLVRESISRLVKSEVSCELEQLFGLPFYSAKYAEQCAASLRVYVPYGCGYLPYAVSAMLKKPTIAWWLFRDLFRQVRY